MAGSRRSQATGITVLAILHDSIYLTNLHKFPEVDAVFTALIKFKSLQERFRDQQTTIGSLNARLHREEAIRDEERKAALVEQGLTQ